MAEESGRTLVCSVLFLDLIGYSKKAVAEQHEAKHQFNSALTEALDLLKRRDRVIVDTGDGAAVVFLGDPEDAMIVGLAMRSGRVAMRLGINLGPVRLISDLNDQTNVIGDGINVAQRVMSFAEPGQLLVSHSYYEVVTRVSEHYKRIFLRVGKMQDKHVRDHDLYLVDDEVRLGEEDLLVSKAEAAAPREPARVADTGANLMISGSSRFSVDAMLKRLVAQGAVALSQPSQVGAKWYASCSHPAKAQFECKVENVGLKRVITGPSRQAVADKVADLVSYGAKQVGDIEEVDGRWTAVCDTRS